MEIVREIEDLSLKKQLKVKDALLSGKSEVLKIYDGSVVFITGGSGFIGKQLVEKLLRTCNVKKIYLLLRPKKGKNEEQRLQQILEDPVYDLLRSEQPNFASKLVPVEGDVIDLNLGISEENQKKIANEVNIIFHGAATINFVEKIKIATLTNVRGTREMVNLARSCKNLKSVVHISTAFVHATKSRVGTEITEDVYDIPVPPESLIQMAESLDNDKLDAMIKPLIEDWPNTYTFTKAVTEELVKKDAEDLPLCIIRPAAVVGAYKEPMSGWVDVNNVYGPSGMILGASLGVSHVILVDNNKVLDLVPVDIVNNALMVGAWETYQRYIAGDKQTKIYFVTSTRNPFLGDDLCTLIQGKARQLSSPKALWYCFAIITKRKFIYWLLTWILHYIPGYIIDGICMLIGEKPRLVKVYKKAYLLSSVFGFFLTNYWIFRDDNAIELYNKLNEADKEIFHFDMGTVNTSELLMSWFYGVNENTVFDLVPFNIVNNAQIVGAWETYQRYTAGDRQTKIYFVTGTRNPLLCGDLCPLMQGKARQLSSPKALWYCSGLVTKNNFMYWLLTWLLHYIPGYTICMLIGEKPRLVKVYKKAYLLSSVFGFFLNNYWIYRDDNAIELYNKLNEADKDINHFYIRTVNGSELLMSWFYGVSQFILKDDRTQFKFFAKKQWWFEDSQLYNHTIIFL